MQQGIVKFFNAERGFGIITPDEGPEVFVHISVLQASGIRGLRDGDRVGFKAEPDRRGRGLRATEVSLA